MSIYLPEESGIYFAKTREYFQEVLSSYANKNYRSATVMLYAVAICDLLLKLQELKDMYNDKTAANILKKIETSRTANDKSKAKWEKELLDIIYNDTELLDFEAYTNLNHLYDHRNFSAHPALNENYELISPSQETTIANIKNILNNVLIKPPIFIKNIVDSLTEELQEKKDVYEDELEKLKTYLDNKYFSRMTQSMKIQTFKSLWKMCFCMSEDEKCMDNLRINRKALEILTYQITEDIKKMFANEELKHSVSVDDKCNIHLIIYLCEFSELYNPLNEDTKLILDKFIEKNDMAKAISWFKLSDFRSHIEYLLTCDNISMDSSTVKFLMQESDVTGEKEILIDFLIYYYGNSLTYYTANIRFNQAVEPYLKEMNKNQVIKLIEVTESNPQIYRRDAAYNDNTKIIAECKQALGDEFDYSSITLKFDQSVLNETNLETTKTVDVF